MGKKLRNRELTTDSQGESATYETILPPSRVVNPSFLRKILFRKKTALKGFTEHKRNRFIERVRSHAFSEVMDPQMFECPICLELIVSPTMMKCGHIYCYRCLGSNTAYSQRCCICRQEQEGVASVPVKLVENLIQKFILPSSPDYFRYLCRTTESNEWQRHRTLATPKLGLVVDFHDICGTWRKGVISKLHEDSLQIRMVISNVPLYEKVDRKSPRLAPYTFFTRNRYLQDFPPSLPEFDNTQSALANLQYKPFQEIDEIYDQGEKSVEGNEQSIEEDDENLRIFNLQMQENELLFNI